MTRRAALISTIHASIFGVTYAGGMVLATAVTAESCTAVTMPGVDAASYASNYLKKYYNDLVDDEPTAPDDSGKKKGGKEKENINSGPHY
jgi:hypothetical protein